MKKYLLNFLLIILVAVIIGCSSEKKTPSIVSATPVVITSKPIIGIDLETVTPIRQTPISNATLIATQEAARPTDLPTPIYYTVVAGDTLFEIARAHGTSVDELLGLNPELDPNLLPVGWQLILPAITPLPTDVVAKGEINTDATILSVNLFDSKTGGLFLLGEIENQGTVALENTQVEVVLENRETGKDEVTRFWVEPGIILPESKAPFGHILPFPYSQMELKAADVIDSNQVMDLGNRYLDLAVENADIKESNGSKYLVGEVSNIGDKTSIRINLVVSLYDESENLSVYYQITFDKPLKPGSKQPFEIPILTPGNQVISFEIILLGLVENAN